METRRWAETRALSTGVALVITKRDLPVERGAGVKQNPLCLAESSARCGTLDEQGVNTIESWSARSNTWHRGTCLRLFDRAIPSTVKDSDNHRRFLVLPITTSMVVRKL